MEEHVGRLRDEPAVAARSRRSRPRPLPRRASARRARRRRRRATRRTSLRAGRARARRRSATARARSTRSSRCGTRARPARRAAAARRRRSRRAAPRRASMLPDVSPFFQSCSRERLQNHASPVSLRQPQRLVVHPREHEHAAVARVLHDRRAKLRLHREAGRRGRAARRAARRAAPGCSWRIDASSAACATPSASATCCALPAPPDAITGSDTASRRLREQLEVVAVARAVAVDRRHEQLARAALPRTRAPTSTVSRAASRVAAVRADAPVLGVDRDDDRLAAERRVRAPRSARAARAPPS